MKTHLFFLLAAATIGAAACSDLTPTDAPASPAAPRPSLSVGAVVCSGTMSVTYSPGLLLTSRASSVQRSMILGPCISLSDPALTSGTTSSTVAISSAACLDPFEASLRSLTINWNTGESSVFTYNQVSSELAGQTTLTGTGTITSGKFAGRTAVRQATGPTPNLLDCLQEPGITSRYYVTQFTIL